MANQNEPSLAILGEAYDELRKLAQGRLRSAGPAASLTPTELLHDTYLRLATSDRERWESREHFFATAALVMRGIVVDRARSRNCSKRSPGKLRVPLEDIGIAIEAKPESVLAVNEAVHALEAEDPRAARVVEFRFFMGMTEPEIAEVLGLSDRTVRRDWVFAKHWLHKRLHEERLNGGGGGESV